MPYFSELPTIYYDFNIAGVNSIHVIRDISTNVRIKKEFLDTITLYDEYDIQDGETPDIISERVYGSPFYHWIIMLMNERFDYINDFPLSAAQLLLHIDEMYGVGNKDAIHHYEDANGRILTSTDPYYDPHTPNHTIVCKLSIGSNVITSSTAGGFGNHPPNGLQHQVVGVGIQTPGPVMITSMTDTSHVVMSSPATVTVETPLEFIHVINDLTFATPVTNFEYESAKNEAKRRIKLLHPSMIGSVLTQLKALTNG